jgi:hypothetical protein
MGDDYCVMMVMAEEVMVKIDHITGGMCIFGQIPFWRKMEERSEPQLALSM